MKVRILGCGTSSGVPRIGGDWGACDPTNPRNRRTRVSLLIEAGGARVLMISNEHPEALERLVPDAALEPKVRSGMRMMKGAKAMRVYYDLHRDTELIAVDTDDHLYSGTIPLPHIRYAWVDPSRILSRPAPHYVPLGIMLTGEQFLAL